MVVHACRMCGIEDSHGARHKKCNQCNCAWYCSTACRDADWPAHKAGCLANAAALAASTVPPNDAWKRWLQNNNGLLTCLTHKVLPREKCDTHAATISVKYLADQRTSAASDHMPEFRVMDVRTASDVEVQRDWPVVYDRLAEARGSVAVIPNIPAMAIFTCVNGSLGNPPRLVKFPVSLAERSALLQNPTTVKVILKELNHGRG